jgi:hypothetical protein
MNLGNYRKWGKYRRKIIKPNLSLELKLWG